MELKPKLSKGTCEACGLSAGQRPQCVNTEVSVKPNQVKILIVGEAPGRE